MPWLDANGLLPGRGAPGGRPTGRGAGALGRARCRWRPTRRRRRRRRREPRARPGPRERPGPPRQRAPRARACAGRVGGRLGGGRLGGGRGGLHRLGGGSRRPAAGLASAAFSAGLAAGGCGRGSGLATAISCVAVLLLELHLDGKLDRRGRRLDELAHLLQLLENFLALDAVLSWRVRELGSWPRFSFWPETRFRGVAANRYADVQDSSGGTHRVLMSCCSSFCRSVIGLCWVRCREVLAHAVRPARPSTVTRRARANALRRTARSKHSVVGCRCAPRPGAVPCGSGTTTGWPCASEPTITRNNSLLAARRRHPMQVRTGPGVSSAGVIDGRTTTGSLAVRRTDTEPGGSGGVRACARNVLPAGASPQVRPRRTLREAVISGSREVVTRSDHPSNQSSGAELEAFKNFDAADPPGTGYRRCRRSCRWPGSPSRPREERNPLLSLPRRPRAAKAEKSVVVPGRYIVMTQGPALASYRGGVKGIPRTKPIAGHQINVRSDASKQLPRAPDPSAPLRADQARACRLAPRSTTTPSPSTASRRSSRRARPPGSRRPRACSASGRTRCAPPTPSRPRRSSASTAERRLEAAVRRQRQRGSRHDRRRPRLRHLAGEPVVRAARVDARPGRHRREVARHLRRGRRRSRSPATTR